MSASSSRRLIEAAAATALALVASVTAAAEPPAPRGAVYDTAPPMDLTVTQRILPQLGHLLDQLLAERGAMTLDGVKVFDSGDKFLPGKIAIGLALLLVETPHDDPRFQHLLAGYGEIADFTVDQPNDSWGIYYYVEALWRLKQAGLLDQAVSPETLARLQKQLDWRRFVRPDLTLIDLPNNYYGVAFSIARLRYLLGWEDDSAGKALLDKMIQHYRRYSGAHGFADETDGEGRFDRYSVLLAGEIAQRFIETGLAPTPEVKAWLRKSVDLLLPRFNLLGEGFEYGRSIGVYGETCFLEVMTAAAKFGLLTPRETAMAYAFSARIAARYAEFWLDPQMQTVNLWEHGRRTDAYRGKHRILGETLSLARQYLYTDAQWNELGFKGAAPDPGYAAWLETLPKRRVTWFARGDYDRLLVTLRDGDHVIGLPVINGGAGEHMTSPYFPVPFSPGMLSGVPDGTAPQLLPRLTLADGSVLMPLAYYKDVRVETAGDATRLRWHQDALDRMGGTAPVADRRIAVTTRYSLSPGRITRIDEFRPTRGPIDLSGVTLEFGSFSTTPDVTGTTARFAAGDVTGFSVEGLSACQAQAFDHPEDGETPVGAFASRIVCSGGPQHLSGPWVVSWTLTYR